MAKDDYFGADGHGLTAAEARKEYIDRMYLKAKREKQKRDAATERNIADQVDGIVDVMMRVENPERRRYFDQLKKNPQGDSLLDRIAETAIHQLRRVRCEELMRGLVSTLVEIGPSVLPIVERSWQLRPNVTHAIRVVYAIGLMMEKMNPREMHSALDQLKWAGDWLSTANDPRYQTVKCVEHQLLQALKAPPAGR
jgi:hypothetical protein